MNDYHDVLDLIRLSRIVTDRDMEIIEQPLDCDPDELQNLMERLDEARGEAVVLLRERLLPHVGTR